MAPESDKAAHLADARLADDCARGDARAIGRFEREFISQVPRFIARISRDAVFVDEVVQRLRERLLVAREGQACRIAEYRGRGPLGAWLRVAAVRVALDLKRASSALSLPTDLRAVPRDVELDLARHRDGKVFRNAVTAAFESLDTEERAVLRLRYVDGLTVERIAVIYGVHAATIVRRLAASRERVVARVRDRLFVDQKLQARDVASLAALVESQLELSLSRLFGESAP